jgi:hypothetical protein
MTAYGPKATSNNVRFSAALEAKADIANPASEPRDKG